MEVEGFSLIACNFPCSILSIKRMLSKPASVNYKTQLKRTFFSWFSFFLQIIEFNDIGDTGFMNETSKETLILSADNFKWRVKSFYQNPDSGTVNFEVTANGYSSEDIVKNGTISFLVSIPLSYLYFWIFSDFPDPIPI